MAEGSRAVFQPLGEAFHAVSYAPLEILGGDTGIFAATKLSVNGVRS
jgi:hypothetical protein